MKKYTFYAILDLFLGLLLLGLGISTLFHLGEALSAFVYVYGFVAIIFGLVETISAVILLSGTDWAPVGTMVLGILNMMVGILLVYNVNAGLIAMTVLFPFWMIFLSVSRLCNLDVVHKLSGSNAFLFSLVVNVVGLLAGFLLLVFPRVSLGLMGNLLGFYLILVAGEKIVFAIRTFQYED